VCAGVFYSTVYSAKQSQCPIWVPGALTFEGSFRTGLEALVAKNSKGKEASSENAAALVIAMSRGIFDSKVVELLVQLGEVLV
jgi:hypothetical protein